MSGGEWSRNIDRVQTLSSHRKLITLFFVFTLGSWFHLEAQERTDNPAFKGYKPPLAQPLILPSDLDSQLLEAFVVIQKANAGDASAQQELGYRYLIGKGLPTDTIRAAQWILKAALQNLPLANFNMGILYNHGWGVPWNPFEGFKHFRAAAQRGMPEALHAVGLLYTENLIVPRDLGEAYQLVKQSADKGYGPARESLVEFEARGFNRIPPRSSEPSSIEKQTQKDSRQLKSTPDSGIGLIFLNFQTDTSSEVSDSTLAKEAMRELEPSKLTPNGKRIGREIRTDTSWISSLLHAAEIGSPEAFVVLGRFFERGTAMPPDPILAAECYLRATRLDSPRAPQLLWKLTRGEQFAQHVKSRAIANDPDALYVWAGLTAVGFDKLLNGDQAFQLLQRAGDHLPSLLETGLCYYSGRWAQQNKEKAIEVWQKAADLGSLEAAVRIATVRVLGETSGQNISSTVRLLKEASKEGSILAESALGYCYEKGIGLSEDKGEAALRYRQSARRGSQSAYLALRRMHDEIRPGEKEFEIPE